MLARVSSNATVEGFDLGAGAVRFPLVPPERGSELALDALRLDAGTVFDLTDPVHDTLVFVHAGGGMLGDRTIDGDSGIVVASGATETLRAGHEGLEAVHATIGGAVDLHAPMGPSEPVVAVARVEASQATGSRSFQILHGPHNGSVRATAFVGYIPPGRAPWHYHLYDEIVWVLSGHGQLHVGETIEELGPGAAFRLHPREVHVVENVQSAEGLVVLGIFTPAGSPSAAYLTADVAEAYVFCR
ncbi:MAG: cupin domain-containing protein [Gaiella sp.]